jgi:RNA polymerase sigma factor (sigma-70 family)
VNTPRPVSEPPSGAPDLIDRIARGDQQAAAEFIRSHQGLIRRRLRHKLGAALRRTTDSEDLVSTLSRRLHAYMATSKIQARTTEQLLGLIMTMAQRSITDKLRALRKAERAHGPEARASAAIRQGDDEARRSAEPRSADKVIASLDSELDREIARMAARGMDHAKIATALGISHSAVRKRWERLKAKLRRSFDAA